MKKNNKKDVSKEVNIGSIIDLPIEDFKKELVNQKVSVGVALNLRLHLIGQYERCKSMSKDLQSSILSGSLDSNDLEVQKSFIGLYTQMQKIEDKVTYLVEYINSLTGPQHTFDTEKH